MNPKQRRYKTEEDIISDIDDARNRASIALEEASNLESKIKQDAMEIARCDEIASNPNASRKEIQEASAHAKGLAFNIEKSRQKIEKLQKRATNLLDKRCKRLGRTLAAFRTIPMECVCGNDKSVVLV